MIERKFWGQWNVIIRLNDKKDLTTNFEVSFFCGFSSEDPADGKERTLCMLDRDVQRNYCEFNKKDNIYITYRFF